VRDIKDINPGLKHPDANEQWREWLLHIQACAERSKNIMKIVSYNIQFGIGLDGRFDCDRIIGALQDADIIALQEVTRNFSSNGDADLVAIFTDAFPHFYHAFASACETEAGSAIIDGRMVQKRSQFGNMILSRYPILAVRNILLPRTRTFIGMNVQRSALETVIMTPDGPLRVYSTHLDHRNPQERIDQIVYLKDRVIQYGLEGGALTGASEFGLPDIPHTDDYIILGDFNMTPESPEYIAMCGPVDAYMGRTMRATLPVDALAHLGVISHDSITWTDLADPRRSAVLDYCFISPQLVSRLKTGGIAINTNGSDHHPVWIKLRT
jgi:endonuclease/exonuclease/phosphatase family metal-dependent hydrolase